MRATPPVIGPVPELPRTGMVIHRRARARSPRRATRNAVVTGCEDTPMTRSSRTVVRASEQARRSPSPVLTGPPGLPHDPRVLQTIDAAPVSLGRSRYRGRRPTTRRPSMPRPRYGSRSAGRWLALAASTCCTAVTSSPVRYLGFAAGNCSTTAAVNVRSGPDSGISSRRQGTGGGRAHPAVPRAGRHQRQRQRDLGRGHRCRRGHRCYH